MGSNIPASTCSRNLVRRKVNRAAVGGQRGDGGVGPILGDAEGFHLEDDLPPEVALAGDADGVHDGLALLAVLGRGMHVLRAEGDGQGEEKPQRGQDAEGSPR